MSKTAILDLTQVQAPEHSTVLVRVPLAGRERQAEALAAACGRKRRTALVAAALGAVGGLGLVAVTVLTVAVPHGFSQDTLNALTVLTLVLLGLGTAVHRPFRAASALAEQVTALHRVLPANAAVAYQTTMATAREAATTTAPRRYQDIMARHAARAEHLAARLDQVARRNGAPGVLLGCEEYPALLAIGEQVRRLRVEA